MAEKRGMTEVELGPTGRAVADAVRTYREARHLTYAALATRLAQTEPIPALGLRRIEARARRVTVDELLALAAALEVAPIELMCPPGSGAPTGAPSGITTGEAWAWIRGETSLDLPSLLEYWERKVEYLESEAATFRDVEANDSETAAAMARRELSRISKPLDEARARLEALYGEVDLAAAEDTDR